MTKHFLLTFIFVAFCVPCFAEEIPSVPELIKKMYDYRASIKDMRANVLVTYPVNTKHSFEETVKSHFYFAYNKERVRCDVTWNTNNPQSHFHQYLSTPNFYFHRNPSSDEASHINDGNSLFVDSPLTQPGEVYDPQFIGMDPSCFSLIYFHPFTFNYDSLLSRFHSPHGKDFNVNIDYIDGEKLYKVSSRQIVSEGIEGTSSIWINPQKGYSFVRYDAGVKKYDLRIIYAVTLHKFSIHKGEIWFPQEIFYQYKMEDTIIEEKVVVDSVEFDVQDETPFTLAGLGIPIGYHVMYFDEDQPRTWDGKELIGEFPFAIEPINGGRWRKLLIVNAIGFALLALLFLYKLLQRRSG